MIGIVVVSLTMRKVFLARRFPFDIIDLVGASAAAPPLPFIPTS
jgi:hypothetical protein